jgi:hypothetical protein
MKWPGEEKRQKLWSEGAQTEGVVVKLWWHSRLQGTYGIEFRVKFPDGSTADVKERFLDASNQGYVSEADVVPVRYDPSDYSKVRLDVPALEAPLKDAKTAQGARVDEALTRLDEPGAGTGGEAGVDGLTPMAKGMEVKAQLDRMAATNTGSLLNLLSGSPGRPRSDPEDRLAKLADLKERGVLSDGEFVAAKAKILGES